MFDIIIYHQSCPDGIFSVYELLRFFKPKYIIPCKAGIMPDLTSIKENYNDLSVIFVDISPVSFESLLKFKNVTICDHHKSAETFFKESIIPNNFEVIFDMERSGAQITSDYICNKFNSKNGRLWITDYVGDRDLWKFKLPFSREINYSFFKLGLFYKIQCHFLKTLTPLDFDTIENFDFYKTNGIQLSALRDKDVEIAAKMAIFKEITLKNKKYKIWISFIQANKSEQGEYLRDKCLEDGSLPDFVAICSFNLTTKLWEISCRSNEDKTDLSILCRSLGGGGHKCASGFKLTYDSFKEIFVE